MIIKGLKKTHVKSVICPACGNEIHRRLAAGAQIYCPFCNAHFYLEGLIFTKGYVPETRVEIKI